MKKKDDVDGLERFKSLNVVLGFMMVLVVDFAESFSPEAIDKALKIKLLLI